MSILNIHFLSNNHRSNIYSIPCTGDSKILSGFTLTIIFKPEIKKVKLLTEYESVTEEVLLSIEAILQNAKQLLHARISWHVRIENYGPRKPRP
jgi:hypothetical protein